MKNLSAFFSTILFLAFFVTSPAGAVCRKMDLAQGLTPFAYAAEPDATIQYFGHNFFQITTRKGTQIVTVD